MKTKIHIITSIIVIAFVSSLIFVYSDSLSRDRAKEFRELIPGSTKQHISVEELNEAIELTNYLDDLFTLKAMIGRTCTRENQDEWIAIQKEIIATQFELSNLGADEK